MPKKKTDAFTTFSRRENAKALTMSQSRRQLMDPHDELTRRRLERSAGVLRGRT